MLSEIKISQIQKISKNDETASSIPSYFVVPDESLENPKTIKITRPIKLKFDSNKNYGSFKLVIENTSSVEISDLKMNGSIEIKTSSAVLNNCFLSEPQKGVDYILTVENDASCEIHNCQFSQTQLYGICVDSSSSCMIYDSLIANCKQPLISITGNSKCICTNTIIQNGETELITAEGSSSLILQKCTLQSAKCSAIFALGSNIVAEYCRFQDNGKGAISLRDSFQNSFLGCEILDSNDTAILLENSELLLDNVTVKRCNGNGITCQLYSCAYIKNSHFFEAEWPLIAFCSGSAGYVNNSVFESSSMSGIIIRGDSNVRVRGCFIKGCAESGVRVSDSRNITFQNTIISECKYCGMEICDSSICKIDNCIFAGGFEVGINIYTSGFANISNSTIFGPFKQAIWAQYGGYGNLSDILMYNLQIPLKSDSIKPFAAQANLMKYLDKSLPIMEEFDYQSSNNSNNNDVDDRFFKIETKWLLTATKCYIVNVGHYELIANHSNVRNRDEHKFIPAKCLKCGKPAIGIHFSPCGHSLFCIDCWNSIEQKPKHCQLCHLPIDVACHSVNCGSDDDICGICYSNKVDTIILPCGHQVCRSCSDKWFMDSPECPFCREPNVQLRSLSSYE